MKTNLNKEIIHLKQSKNAVILVHNYQLPEIQDIGDFIGDSLELSRTAQKVKENIIVFCGVKFMAETAKILSPDKKVLLPVSNALCPMAEMINSKDVLELREKYPDAVVVSYVNTNADVKAVSDVCCTSANAVKVVKSISVKKIIFTPDKNLGWWVQKNLPEKEIILWDGYCRVHQHFRAEDIDKCREILPDAEVVVHPECPSDVLIKADTIASTSGMLRHVKESKLKTFIIGTEEGIIYKMRKENPEKKFFSLGTARTCLNMKKIRLNDVLNSLEEEKYEITLSEKIINNARKSLEEMVKYV